MKHLYKIIERLNHFFSNILRELSILDTPPDSEETAKCTETRIL